MTQDHDSLASPLRWLWKRLRQMWSSTPGSPDNLSVSPVCFPQAMRLKDVALPRTDIFAADMRLSLSEVRDIFLKSNTVALPVFDGKLDHIKGWISLADVTLKSEEDWAVCLHPVFFAAASMPLLEAAYLLEHKNLPFLLVVDEYGAVDGLVSRDLILSALVNQLKELEPKETPEMIIDQGDGAPVVDARMRLESLGALMGQAAVPLIQEMAPEVDTVGGLVCHLAGRVPLKGEIIRDGRGLVCEVVDADARKIKRVSIRFQPQAFNDVSAEVH